MTNICNIEAVTIRKNGQNFKRCASYKCIRKIDSRVGTSIFLRDPLKYPFVSSENVTSDTNFRVFKGNLEVFSTSC